MADADVCLKTRGRWTHKVVCDDADAGFEEGSPQAILRFRQIKSWSASVDLKFLEIAVDHGWSGPSVGLCMYCRPSYLDVSKQKFGTTVLFSTHGPAASSIPNPRTNQFVDTKI